MSNDELEVEENRDIIEQSCYEQLMEDTFHIIKCANITKTDGGYSISIDMWVCDLD